MTIPSTISDSIIAAGQFLAARGWAPATAGNYSMRFMREIAITQSGRWKGNLQPTDLMTMDLTGKTTSAGKPSDEALLHITLYKLFPDVGAVLHTHSIPCTTLTLMMPRATEIILEGYELQKAYPGIHTHVSKTCIPIFDNSQDMQPLATQIEKTFAAPDGIAPVFLLRGHGLYGWGGDMNVAKRVVEATEFMLSCELEKLKIARVA
ncbi:MAG TPA: methylthioribulose 1-phosphate dehydratase [Rhodospirillaceae bacterium]|nr:methylthioribulose 1-phosphate dehydratase [Rhodospirillaceae bacterium]